MPNNINLNTDLTNCDLEPIHILGKLQPHGYMIALAEETLTVSYVSKNFGELFGTETEKILGLKISELKELAEKVGDSDVICPILERIPSMERRENYEVSIISLSGKDYYAVSHLYKGNFVFEFEPKILKKDIFSEIHNINSKILGAPDLDTMFETAAYKIRSLIDYDRVLIYKFLQDDSGVVVAEAARNDDKVYMGLHFPESDIPKQARKLYVTNKVRLINNALSTDIDILGKYMQPIDLTHSILRSVSPMHIQYLANMGVVSSFSISIVYEGRLWGLIACHNSSLMPVDYQIRDACRLFADLISNSVKSEMDKQKANLRADIHDKMENLVQQISESELLSNALLRHSFTLLDFISADGAVTYISGVLTSKGAVPENEEIRKIIRYSRENDESWNTHSLSTIFPDFEPSKNNIAGALVQPIGSGGGDFLIWFRKEVIHEVEWAGEPAKVFEDVVIDGIKFQQINPRKSFETWVQSVKNCSKPWTEEDVQSAQILANQLVDITFRQYKSLQRNNLQLQVAYSEMDNFINSVSHDIGNPLTAIKLNAQQMLGKSTEPAAKEKLNSIIQQSDKINSMLLQFKELSKISGDKSVKSEIEMPLMIFDIIDELVPRYAANRTVREIGELHNIYGNEVAIYQIFSNIIGNAIKYSSRSESPHIKVESFLTEKSIQYRIYDNGIGIPADTKDIFDAFVRDDSAKDFEGSGVGLSIVKNLLLRHNATIHYISCMNEGTCFYITFPNPMDKLAAV